MRPKTIQTEVMTPEMKGPTKDLYHNQKKLHAKSKKMETCEITPIRKYRLRRRMSLGRLGSSCSSTITPLSSDSRGESLPVIIRSSSSSGYHSLKKHKNVLLESTGKFKPTIRRRLSCDHDVGQPTKVARSGKYRCSAIIEHASNLLPRAMHCLRNMPSNLELWECMVEKERTNKRDPNYFSRHDQVTPEMRSTLIEWMNDVCEAYSLDSETLFLALDYLDRYLSATNQVPIIILQALGTTSLHIASKLHEISPPTIDSFVNVTDGACTNRDILVCESHILSKIDWKLQCITPLGWLLLFLKISSCQDVDADDDDKESRVEYKGPLTRTRYTRPTGPFRSLDTFMKQQVDPHSLMLSKNILISCISDAGSLRFSYSVIAASILYLTTSIDVFDITGFGSEEIGACTKWLRPFAKNASLRACKDEGIPIGHRAISPPSNCSRLLKDCTNDSLLISSKSSSGVFSQSEELGKPSRFNVRVDEDLVVRN